MANEQQCPQCGAWLPADAPQGVCPRCVMGLGMAEPNDEPDVTQTQSPAGSFHPPKPGQLASHFPQLDILELVGHGGMGAVYKARQRELDRFVALKILPPEISNDPSFAERFTREARALARLNHPNIVGIHDSGQAGGYYFLIMEFVDGVNLRQAVRNNEMSPKEALAIVPQICEALQFAHDAGIVHRDIKPENVLLNKKGQVKVADFGLAKLVEESPDGFTLTGTHQVMGTPRYMAPEQIEGARAVDHRADIYSLGVVFYELLTGELPLGRFSPPSEKAQVDARLDDVVMRTLEKEPDQRYQNVGDVKTDVDTINQGIPQVNYHTQGYEYRSKTEFFGIPLVHIASGRDPETGRTRTAKGIIAIGDKAVGGIAIGGASVGIVAIGGAAFGLIALGGAAAGVLLALGGAAASIGCSLGGGAIGLLALGGLAIGFNACGGLAIGYNAHGGLAIGHIAAGAQPIGNNTSGPVSQADMLAMWSEMTPDWIYVFPLVATILFVTWFTRLFSGESEEPEESPLETGFDDDFDYSGRRHKKGWGVALTVALILPCFIMCLCPISLFFVRSTRFSRPNVAATSVDESTHDHGHDAPSVYVNTLDYGWEFTTDGPKLTNRCARDLNLNLTQRDAVNVVLQGIHQKFLKVESTNTKRRVNELGHQVISIEGMQKEVVDLENELWTGLDEILTVNQQRSARDSLHYDPARYYSEQSDKLRRGLFGWRNAKTQIELWKVGSWYHWNLIVTWSGNGVGDSDRGPELPKELRKFWQERGEMGTAEASSEEH